MWIVSSSFIQEIILNPLYLCKLRSISDYHRGFSGFRCEIQWHGPHTHMHIHQIVVFDMEITLTAQQRRVYPFTFSVQCQKGRWYTMYSCLPYGYVCSHFHSDYDKSPSMQCTMMTENECWISFNVVGGEKGTTAYNLQMYGMFYNNI